MLSRSSPKVTVSELTEQISGGSPGLGPLFRCTTRTFSLWGPGLVVMEEEEVVEEEEEVVVEPATGGGEMTSPVVEEEVEEEVVEPWGPAGGRGLLLVLVWATAAGARLRL